MGGGGQLRCLSARNAATYGSAARCFCHCMGTFTREVGSSWLCVISVDKMLSWFGDRVCVICYLGSGLAISM